MDIKELNNLLVGGAAKVITEHNGTPFMVVPAGHTIADLEHLLPAPTRIHETVLFYDITDFAAYINRFKQESTTVFAYRRGEVLRAKLDYHNPGEPSHCGHKAQYECVKTDEWKAWMEHNNRPMDQVAFAEFLEDRIDEIVEPDGASLLEMVTNMQIIRQAEFANKVDLNTGEFQFSYSEDNKKGTVEIPRRITIAVAPFENFDAYKVQARIKYTLREGKLTLRYELIEPQKVVEDAFDGIAAKAKELIEDGVPFYNGH